MLPAPPTPPLFPYTTLFRSDRMAGTTTLPADQHSELLDALSHVALAADRPRVEFLLSTLEAVRSRGPGYEVAFNIDRKSTRLNSSHLVISYAVFCLKKKKHD